MTETHQVGVSEKAIVVNSAGKILALHRTASAPTRPNAWDLPGGDLDFGEDPETGIMREIKEESGLEAVSLKLLDAASSVSESGEFWVTIAYTATTHSDEVMLSFEHDEFRWVTPVEFLKLGSSPKLERFVKKLIA